MVFDPVAYKQSVTAEWQRAAKGWNHWIPTINAWLHEATELMLDQAGVAQGSKVIDIAAGDGGQSIAAAARVGTSGKVLATDIAPEFVNLANGVAIDMGLTQLRAEVMDAEALTAPEGQFDAAISRLGLMYLPDLQKGLTEIKRVLRPGGRVSAIVFTTPQKTPFFSIPVKMIREKQGLPPPPPGQPGPFSLGTPGFLADQYKAAGFQNIQEQTIQAPVRMTSAQECVQWRREASGTMQQLLSGLDDEAQQQMWQDIEQALRQYETPDGFESPCEILVCGAAS